MRWAADPMSERSVFRDDHALFRAQVRRFIASEIAPHYAQWERDGITPRALWRAAGEAGLLNCQLPEPYGLGGDFGHAAVRDRGAGARQLPGHRLFDPLGHGGAVPDAVRQRRTAEHWLPAMARAK